MHFTLSNRYTFTRRISNVESRQSYQRDCCCCILSSFVFGVYTRDTGAKYNRQRHFDLPRIYSDTPIEHFPNVTKAAEALCRLQYKE